MFNETVQQIYNMLYSPVLSPYSLVDNAKLDNYDYVTYSKEGALLLVTMQCTVDDEQILFKYWFTKDDFLLKLTMETNSLEEVLFERDLELTALEKRYLQQRNNATQAV